MHLSNINVSYYSSIHVSNYLFIYPPMYQIIHPPMFPAIYSSFILLFWMSFIHPLIYPCIHSFSLTSPDVPESLSLALHPYTVPAAGSVQVEGGDERQSNAGQVLLHAAARHLDQRGQRVLTDGVINAVCQHITWSGEEESGINPFS